MAANRHTTTPGANGPTSEGPLVLPEKVVRQLKPPLLRVVVALAMEKTIEKIAEDERITTDGVRKRFDRVHKILGKKTTIGALYILLLAGIVPMK